MLLYTHELDTTLALTAIPATIGVEAVLQHDLGKQSNIPALTNQYYIT